jgi:hypothetical protein
MFKHLVSAVTLLAAGIAAAGESPDCVGAQWELPGALGVYRPGSSPLNPVP